MKTITTTVYTFAELTDSAKEKARDWWREGYDFSSEGTDYLYDDFIACGKLLGISIDTGKRDRPAIYWSGFSSQGDGASFEGHYSYAKGAGKAIRAHAPQDAELHRIADSLRAIQRKHFYKLSASVTQGRGSHYSHAWTMQIEVEDANSAEPDMDAAESVRDLLRDFANWMYRQLEKEYEYQTSNEAVDDNIQANEYTFTESGKRFG